MDFLMNWPLLIARMGTVPGGFPSAASSMEFSVAEMVTGVVLRLKDSVLAVNGIESTISVAADFNKPFSARLMRMRRE